MAKSLKSQEKLSKLAFGLIQKAKKITLLTHFRPDGDGMSSCAALSHILQALGKQVETIYPNKAQLSLKRSPKPIYINKHKQTPDLIIALDTANYGRLYYPENFKNIPLINIDHHISNSINGTCNFIETKSSSTCEILFELLKNWYPKLINKYVAECLLFGILCDGQVFHTQAITGNTLRVSADLMDLGANLYKLKTELLTDKNPQIITLWGKMMSNINITPKGNAAWTYITQKDLKKYDIKQAPLLGFNNFLSQIAGIDMTLLFHETDTGQTKVSLRSKKTDVNKLAAKFGGGGHKNAAGILSDKPIMELIKEVTKNL